MGKSRKMAKTSISHKNLKKNSEDRKKMMTQKMEESKTIFKPHKENKKELSLFPKSEKKQRMIRTDNVDLKLVALDKFEQIENEEAQAKKYKKPSSKQRRAKQMLEYIPEFDKEKKSIEEKMVESLKKSLEKQGGLSRGQRKRNKKKERILHRMLLEKKIEMDLKLTKNKK